MEALAAVTSDLNSAISGVPQLQAPPMIEIELDEAGIIRNCNGTCEAMVGFSRDELVSHPISMLIHKLAEFPLILNHDLNPVLDYLCHCGMPFQVERKAGGTFFSEVRFIHLQHLKTPRLRLLASPVVPGRSGPPMLP